MRVAESINLVFFLFLSGLAAFRPLPLNRRVKAVATGVAGIAVIWAAQYLGMFLKPNVVSIVRDWLPSPLILMVYWQAGQFFVQPRQDLQEWLMKYDRRFVYPLLRWLAGGPVRAATATYLELSYLFCYPLVPAGLATLYLVHQQAYADRFWTIVLPPSYFCYIMVAFFQTLPPRALEPPPDHARGVPVRSLNLMILQHGSIHANTFPSAHVAASVAVALALFHVAPWAGLLFLWIAVSVALGAVIGRYHYVADAFWGAILAGLVFAVERLTASTLHR